MGQENRGTSINIKLLRLLLLSTVIAVLFFLSIHYGGTALIDYYFDTSDYIDKKNNECYNSLQEYIDQRGLVSKNAKELSTWVEGQSVVCIQIFKDGVLLYDSNYPEVEEIEVLSEDYYGWEEYYTLQFADGQADVFIYGYFTYQFYNYALILELILSFVLFVTIVLLGIQRTMRYIQKLKDEIEILEGGDLDYKITIDGNDELAVLAGSLEEMRKSFKSQIERENELSVASQNMITEMSHDLRTPLTSMLLYTEILQKKKYRNEEELQEYIKKIETKAYQMKQLSDHIFEYALVGGDSQVQLEHPELFRSVFYEQLSEMLGFLQDKGFEVNLDVTWYEKKIVVNYEYVNRILDNIVSNVVKYAHPGSLIMISSLETPESVGLTFENLCNRKRDHSDSNHIGIQNMEKMMRQMHGHCKIEESGKLFQVSLFFRAF